MTGLALSLSLIPILMSDGAGADMMKRIAAPMVGGPTSAMMVLLVFPALFVL
jgi:copper/silver efflux system protein